MDESAIKGGDLELNGSDADVRKSSSSMMSRIYVKGYDTKLPGHVLVQALTEHFASCGELIHVYFPGLVSLETRILNRFAFIYLRGEGAEEKALKLDGSCLGGRKLVVKAWPFGAKRSVMARTRDVDNRRGRRMTVRGFDTSLPAAHVRSTLIQHFSKCGIVRSAVVYRDDSKEGVLSSIAFVTLRGQSAINKALQLGGCDVEGFKNVVVSRVALPDPSPALQNSVGKFKHHYFSPLDGRKR